MSRYEEPITAGLDALIRDNGLQPNIEPLDPAESAEVLAAHRGLSVANAILDRLLNE